MSVWPFLSSAAGLIAGLALFAALIWAAAERGRVHRWWRALTRTLEDRNVHLPQWCVAMGTVAGCA